MTRLPRLVALALACAPTIARAQPAPAQPAPAPAPPAAPAPAPQPAPASAPQVPAPDDHAQLEQLEQRLEKLEAQQQSQQAVNDGTRQQVATLMPLLSYITVFVDLGAFAVAGNGSGIRNDYGNVYYPRDAYAPGQWVFLGDPLSTAINALGEPADTSDSREIRNDTIHSGGHPSFLVNSVGLAVGHAITDEISISALAELLPRPGGDLLDVELAHVDYKPFEDTNLWIMAGKIDSVLGVEYRSQDAPRRLEVTPSLICRYTCGRQLGVEARLVEGRLSASGAITNGDNFIDRFEPSDTIHANSLPTASGHLQWMLPVGQGLEIGISGAIGPQDKQPDLDVLQWHVGFDARLTDLYGFDAVAEYVQGLQQGKTTSPVPCNAAPCLDYKGGYLLLDRRMNAHLTPYVRLDWRDAIHRNGDIFIYESHVWRATLGVHLDLTRHVTAKVEYTFNNELDNIPDFPDDVFTSSLVVATD